MGYRVVVVGATGNVASPSALYVVAGGGNNARAALGAVAGGADPGTTAAATAASSLFHTNTGCSPGGRAPPGRNAHRKPQRHQRSRSTAAVLDSGVY